MMLLNSDVFINSLIKHIFNNSCFQSNSPVIDPMGNYNVTILNTVRLLLSRSIKVVHQLIKF